MPWLRKSLLPVQRRIARNVARFALPAQNLALCTQVTKRTNSKAQSSRSWRMHRNHAANSSAQGGGASDGKAGSDDAGHGSGGGGSGSGPVMYAAQLMAR